MKTRVDHGSRKIVTLERLAGICAGLRAKGKRVVLCHGVFDLLHPGHIRHLQAARRRGDALVVTVTRDEHVNKGPGRPVFPEQVRAETLAALGCVAYVALNESPTAVETLRRLRPRLYVKGQDYRDAAKDPTGGIAVERSAAESVGAELDFTDEPRMSSTELLNTHFGVYPPEARPFLRRFAGGCSAQSAATRLESLKGLRVLVVGEAIIDEYHYCQATGKSPKETFVSTRFLEEEIFAGGALAVANHLAGFAREVRLVTCLGAENSREAFIRGRLRANIQADFYLRKGVSTIVKRRFVDPSFLTKMFQVSYLDDEVLEPPLEDRLLKRLAELLPRCDLVVAADYGHGMIGPRVVDLLCRKARVLAVNTQTNSSNLGYNVITKYPRAGYICIDEPELRLAHRNRHGDIKELMLATARRLKASRIVVTRGHRGAIAYEKGARFTEIPVFSQRVVDRTGAGDAFLALSALCVAAGLPLDFSAFIGNAAGAMKVSTVCNRTPVEPVALRKFVTALLS